MKHLNLIRRLTTASLSTAMLLSAGTLVINAEDNNPLPAQNETQQDLFPEGVSVTADANSPTGYTARFAYNPKADSRLNLAEGETITGVQLSGTFRLISGKVDTSVGSDHKLDAYQNGDYCANLHPHTRSSGQSGLWMPDGVVAGSVFDMQQNGDQYQISIPIVSGAHAYSYVTTITAADGSTRTVMEDDPKNPSLTKLSAHSNSPTSDSTNSIVYGKWDPLKQSESPNLDFATPYEGNRGTVQYVEYQGEAAPDQDMGIYLPYDYDPNRSEPYKVIYTSHGAWGNETYWFAMGQANNVMDRIAADDPDQEAIIVNLDNTQYADADGFGWKYDRIGNNVVNFVIPYMEANYNVSKDKKDRAFCGFSMGSMTTTYMAFHYPDVFGYFGIFSGCNIGNATFKQGFTYDEEQFYGPDSDAYLQIVYDNIEIPQALLDDVIFTQAGTVDTAVHANGFNNYGAYETIRNWAKRYMPAGHFIDGGLVPGSHDLYTWAQCFNNFAKDIVWKDNTADIPVIPSDPSDATDTAVIYRLYNPASAEHLFTSDLNEYRVLPNYGWRQEGVAWNAPKTSDKQVTRLNNNLIGGHLYTTDDNEIKKLTNGDWVKDEVSFYSADADQKPVYRLYNRVNYQHLLTTDENEKDVLTKGDWQLDNTSIYAMK